MTAAVAERDARNAMCCKTGHDAAQHIMTLLQWPTFPLHVLVVRRLLLGERYRWATRILTLRTMILRCRDPRTST